MLHGGVTEMRAVDTVVLVDVAPLRAFAKLTPREQDESPLLRSSHVFSQVHVCGASPTARFSHDIMAFDDGLVIAGGRDGQRYSPIREIDVLRWRPPAAALRIAWQTGMFSDIAVVATLGALALVSHTTRPHRGPQAMRDENSPCIRSFCVDAARTFAPSCRRIPAPRWL